MKGLDRVCLIDLQAISSIDAFHGRILGLEDVVTFQGRSLDELRREMAESVEDYLQLCQTAGKEPERPYSGEFLVRPSPELHRAVSVRAQATGMSLNALAETAMTSGLACDDNDDASPGLESWQLPYMDPRSGPGGRTHPSRCRSGGTMMVINDGTPESDEQVSFLRKPRGGRFPISDRSLNMEGEKAWGGWPPQERLSVVNAILREMEVLP